VCRIGHGRSNRSHFPTVGPLRVLCHEYRRSKRRCATIREMKEGLRGRQSGVGLYSIFAWSAKRAAPAPAVHLALPRHPADYRHDRGGLGIHLQAPDLGSLACEMTEPFRPRNPSGWMRVGRACGQTHSHPRTQRASLATSSTQCDRGHALSHTPPV
jgi:hypothetical protein